MFSWGNKKNISVFGIEKQLICIPQIIAPDKLGYPETVFFFYFCIKAYVVGTHLKHLIEALLMSTHNICFHGEIKKKMSLLFRYKSALSEAMPNSACQVFL